MIDCVHHTQKHTSTPKFSPLPEIQFCAGALPIFLPSVSPAPHIPRCIPRQTHSKGHFPATETGMDQTHLSPALSKLVRTSLPPKRVRSSSAAAPSAPVNGVALSRGLPALQEVRPSRPGYGQAAGPWPGGASMARAGSPRAGAIHHRWVGAGASLPSVPQGRAAAAGDPRVPAPAPPAGPGGTHRVLVLASHRVLAGFDTTKSSWLPSVFYCREGQHPRSPLLLPRRPRAM